ncbi:MAG TPA: nucleotidyl transferase AbiEii/AbiGii toxin family protein [Rhizomicrobium sp.]|nr:nucleotidyl transferase AbiEii/AbiGii toxin family protein [Rhizomicrobium sp.]
MKEEPKNVAASIRQRLLNARKGKQDFQRMLLQYAIERLLFRLSQSSLRDSFILKGAMLFALWTPEPFRSTGDLDFLGFGPNDVAAIRSAFQTLCTEPVTDDGLSFDPKSIEVETMREEEEYQGARVRLRAHLGTAVIPLQIDIGFGDIVHPAPLELDYPVLVADLPAPRIRAYPPQTVIAEKLEAMVRFGELTSRLKDHYDIWALSQIFGFKMHDLVTAIEKTFAHRKTDFPSDIPLPLTDEFARHQAKLAQWKAFLKRTSPTMMPPPFPGLLAELRGFLGPVISALQDSPSEITAEWRPGQGWS